LPLHIPVRSKFLKFRVSIIHHKGSQAEAKRFITASINRLCRQLDLELQVLAEYRRSP